MENKVAKPNLSIYAAQGMMKDFWGIEMNQDLFLEWGDDAIRRIGYNVDKIKVQVQVQENGYVYLPCEAVVIKGVTSTFDVFNRWNAVAVGEDATVALDVMGAAGMDTSLNENILHGDLVDFEVESPSLLHVTPLLEGESVYVLVVAKILDEEGLPMLTKKQAAAVATHCAFIYTQRNAMAGIKGIDLAYIRSEAEKAIAGARIPEHVSDNQWDQVLDAKTSHGRKHFNRNHSYGG